MSLTRLSDRIDKNEAGEETIIKRYGMWGTMSEIEKRGSYYFVIDSNKKEVEKFKRLVDAESFLKELVTSGHA